MAALAGLPAQTAALQAQVAALAGLPAQIAALQAALLGGGVAPVMTVQQRISAARAINLHVRGSDAFVPPPRPNGTLPPNWPAGFNRPRLRQLGGAALQQLLANYNLAPGGTDAEKRDRIALHIDARLPWAGQGPPARH